MSARAAAVSYTGDMSGFAQRAGRSLRNGLRAIALPTLFLLLVAYFLWNATQGLVGR